MDLKTVLSEVGAWPVDQRLRLVAEVWDGLCKESPPAEADDELKRLLDHRLASVDQNPDAAIPWETVEARAIERLRK